MENYIIKIARLAKPLFDNSNKLKPKIKLTWPRRLKYYPYWIRDTAQAQEYWLKRLGHENVVWGKLKGPISVFNTGSDIKWH